MYVCVKYKKFCLEYHNCIDIMFIYFDILIPRYLIMIKTGCKFNYYLYYSRLSVLYFIYIYLFIHLIVFIEVIFIFYEFFLLV